ncbi:hypothetical protein RQP46_000761 [Phenoliferia psychrophenolica]
MSKLMRTPNGRRESSSLDGEPNDLPADLREALGTPKGGSFGSQGGHSRSRSDSPMSLFRDRNGREGGENDGEEEDRRRSIALEAFKLHHPGPSEYSIHSAPADFDSPAQDDRPDYVDSPNSAMSPTASRYYDDVRRRSSVAFRLPFSLYEYLQEEIMAGELDEEEGVKSERVTNFLTVPGEVEKVRIVNLVQNQHRLTMSFQIILFGVVICLDSFLYTFTILPLRMMAAFSHLVSNTRHNLFSRARRRHLRLSHKCDLAKAVILAGTLLTLHRITDASKMYHSVRGQETIKLYVLFNVLEIADRLCCSFGQDLQDSLFSRQTFGRRTDGSRPHIRPIALIALNTAYVVAHTLVLIYQLVTLNVAINSFSNALLSLLLSNQFVEIKGSVFKKFEKENLFQLTCADIVERFQLGLMLFIIAIRNWIELSSASSSSLFAFLPASFSLALALPSFPSLSLLQTIFSPAIVVLLSECLVDWLKHAFITKFNHIRPAVYGRYIDVLCKDLVAGAGRRQDQPFVDQSPVVSRRLGFASLPLGCLVVRIIFQAFEMLADDSHVDECDPRGSLWSFPTTLGGTSDWSGRIGGWLVFGMVILIAWACLIALKLLIGINLRAYASARWARMEENAQEDELNDRSRPPIGLSNKERQHEREAAKAWDDNAIDVPGKVTKISLTTLSRYDMIKSRVW